MEKKKMPKFVEQILVNSKDPKEYEKVYYKPGKVKTIAGFIFSCLFLILLIRIYGLKVNTYYVVLFLGDVVIITYFALNLFTKQGFLLPKIVEKIEEQEENKPKKKRVVK